ncbi:MAG: MIP/aquaporin family protein [Candidatus Acidiferrales bacterium]
MRKALQNHWPEYLIEAGALGTFMISACTFAAILGHPMSPVQMWFTAAMPMRMVMGLAMGLTAVGIIYSPWGKRSGAHMNPSVTFTFWRLGKIESWDAIFYVCAQFIGGACGVLLIGAVLHPWVSHPAVNYAVTLPGDRGPYAAFVAEVVISALLMSVILNISNSRNLARYTGIFAGCLVAAYITLEAPISGMSMNPARTASSAFSAHLWTAWWIYFTAPPLGMLLAAEVFVRLRGAQRVLCAKLHHQNNQRCIFRCGYAIKAPSSN